MTAAPETVPDALVEQLAIGERMVLPIGSPMETQVLSLCRKDENGRTTKQNILSVAFVTMIRRKPNKE